MLKRKKNDVMSVWWLETNTDRLRGIRPRFREKAAIYSNESRMDIEYCQSPRINIKYFANRRFAWVT